jgi:hypothetical protein
LTIRFPGLSLHRVKRFVGLIEKGFESLRRLGVRADRLYEQGADSRRLWRYITRWTRWLWGALDELVTRRGGVKRYMVYVLKQLQISGIRLPQA